MKKSAAFFLACAEDPYMLAHPKWSLSMRGADQPQTTMFSYCNLRPTSWVVPAPYSGGSSQYPQPRAVALTGWIRHPMAFVPNDFA